MIGEGDRGHVELDRPLDQPVDAAGAVEEAVVGVDVKVDKIGDVGRHRGLSKAFGAGAQGPMKKRGKNAIDAGAAAWLIAPFSLSHLRFDTCLSKSRSARMSPLTVRSVA